MSTSTPRTFDLRPEDAADLPCEYGRDLEDAVKEYLDCRVLVSGTITPSRKTKRLKMSADTIELVTKDHQELREVTNSPHL